jgi:RNA polymerase sigma-70 factor (ECF subfamily)
MPESPKGAVSLPIAAADRCDPKRLVELVKGGDAAALDDITRCYRERLLAAGKRHCRTSTEAEDAVQDALLFAATEPGAFRAEGSLEGYLLKVVARACRRLSRGTKNDAAAHDSEAQTTSKEPSPEARAAEHELGSALDALLLSLPATDRAILLLAELEDRTAGEIGAELGLSAGAVRTRLTRLRQRLRHDLSVFLNDGGESTPAA